MFSTHYILDNIIKVDNIAWCKTIYDIDSDAVDINISQNVNGAHH